MEYHYKLIPVLGGAQTYLSMSTDSARPDEYLEDLQQELRAATFRGQVVFDLLLSNGFNKNRFFTAEFDGESINLQSFSELEDVPSVVSEVSVGFYQENYDLVATNAILSKSQKFLVKRGRI